MTERTTSASSKAAKPAKDMAAAPKAASGFARPMTLSPALAAVIGPQPGPRTDVTDTTTYTYYDTSSPGNYAIGDLASIKNALDHITTITRYDASGRPLSITDPNNVVTELVYDPRGRLIAQTVGGRKTSYLYNASGQLTRITLPDASYLAYTYDTAHRLTSITDRGGNKIQYTLDKLNNITKEIT